MLDGFCPYRSVSDDGRLFCQKIVQGDKEVSPEICKTCPARACDCSNLRFSLKKRSPSPIVVRWNGHVEIWDNDPPQVSFLRAACAVSLTPIASPEDCAGCVLHTALSPASITSNQPKVGFVKLTSPAA